MFINVRTRTTDVQIHLKAVETRSAIPGQGTMWRKLCFITNRLFEIAQRSPESVPVPESGAQFVLPCTLPMIQKYCNMKILHHTLLLITGTYCL